jgi:hypothetical protein
MCGTVGEHVRRARASPNNYEEPGAARALLSANAMLDGALLFGIQLFMIDDGHGQRIVQAGCLREACFSLVRNVPLRSPQMWERQQLLVPRPRNEWRPYIKEGTQPGERSDCLISP